MENSIRYYKYLLRKSLLQIIIGIIFIGVFVSSSSLTRTFSYYTQDYTYGFDSDATIWILVFAGLIFAFDELKALNNRRNLDLWYSLPLSRTQLIVTKYLAGFTKLLILYIESMIIWTIGLLTAPKMVISDYTQLPALMLIAFVAVLLFYTFGFAIFSFANSDRDGIIFIFGHAIIYNTLWTTIVNNYHLFIAGDYERWNYSSRMFSISIYDFILNISSYFDEKILITRNSDYILEMKDVFPTTEIIGTFIYLVVAILFLVIAVLYARKRDASKVEGVSETWFGYKTLIPLFALCFCFSIPFLSVNIVYLTFITVIYVACLFIAYTFYRRSIKFNKSDYVMIAILLAVKIIMNIVYSGMSDQLALW